MPCHWQVLMALGPSLANRGLLRSGALCLKARFALLDGISQHADLVHGFLKILEIEEKWRLARKDSGSHAGYPPSFGSRSKHPEHLVGFAKVSPRGHDSRPTAVEVLNFANVKSGRITFLWGNLVTEFCHLSSSCRSEHRSRFRVISNADGTEKLSDCSRGRIQLRPGRSGSFLGLTFGRRSRVIRCPSTSESCYGKQRQQQHPSLPLHRNGLLLSGEDAENSGRM